MKKTIIILNLFLLLFIFFAFSSNKIYASTPDAYMIVANPGEDASYEMRIGWHTDLQYTQSYIEYTEKSDINWNNKKKVLGTYEKVDVFNGIQSKDPKGKDIVESAIFLDYSVVLSDLKPDTEYMYRVGQDTLSEIQYFKTAGNTEFSFAWISDFHAYDPLPSRLNSAMNMLDVLDKYNNGFDFVFSTGDEIAWGGSYSHWLDIFEKNYHKNYMWASVIGNHDYMDKTNTKNCNDFFKSVYNFPVNGYAGEEGVCYYFKYSNVLFITMNNETQRSASAVKKAQDWFVDVVTKNPAQYIVVAQHYQWFDGTNGSFNNASGYGRWCELFDEYKVDLAISGNNHIYVRSKLLYEGKVSNDYNFGTTYIQTCSADNERGQAMGTLTHNQNLIAKRFTEGGSTMGGIIVNVNEKEIQLELLDRNGTVIDKAVVNARRDVYPMDNFDREKFESNIQYINTNIDNKGIIAFDSCGLGYVREIQIIKDNEVLTATNLKKDIDIYQTIFGLEENTTNDLEIKITYIDKSTSSINIQANTKVIEGELKNLLVSIVDKGYKITFDNTFTDYDEIEVSVNNSYDTPISINNNEIIIEDLTPSINDIIKIFIIKDEKVIYKGVTNYYSPTDINCDGISDKEDISYLQSLICNSIPNDTTLYNQYEEVKYYYDLNNDGSLDIKDVIYLAMNIDGKLPSPMVKQFKVTFVNADGKVIETQLVNALDDAIAKVPTYDGYVFVKWDTDFTNVTQDIVVKAIYVKE